ncbi:ATP-dependent DNA helicase DinG [Marinobacteraceae bacterium S3BR75-40.1]
MLDEQTKATIQSAYRDVLKGKDIRARYGQRLMIAEIARYLGGITQSDNKRSSPPSACVVEAGTGTGKTLAYLLATIPVAKALNKKLVIATATVALQDQIVLKDLPDVRSHTGLDFNWTLAKGRGRYLCLSRLEARLQETGSKDSESMPLFLLEGAEGESEEEKVLFQRMLSEYAQRKWDGDRDHWPEQIDTDTWRKVTTDHRQCTNRHCHYFDSCAFFGARGEMEQAEVIVANHDLVLADLALGGGAILPPPEDTIYVLDEAHHLPEKALNHFAATLGLQGARQNLKALSQALAKLIPALAPGTAPAKSVEKISSIGRDLDPLLNELFSHLEQNTPWEPADQGDEQYRYPEGRIPEKTGEIMQRLLVLTATQTRELGQLSDEMQKGLGDKECEIDRMTAEAWYPVMATFHARSEEQVRLWRAFTADIESSSSSGAASGKDSEEATNRAVDAENSEIEAPATSASPSPARWLRYRKRDQGADIILSSSPVLADNVLYSRLWNRCYGAVLTSATLTALGKFDRFRMRAGTPAQSRFLVVPSAFRYAEMATVAVPAMHAEPSAADAFTEALVERLPSLWSADQSTLVLFTSRRQMRDVLDRLSDEQKTEVMTQEDMSRAEVLRSHREKIDQGQKSVLFGLASFAEGIDLPGDYLQHVIITRLPFSVPDNPIEASLAEWITQRGGNPFLEISVPDASIRLVQAAGRLLRTESDTGRITILDRRIITRRYGQLLLDSLPPFQRQIEA